MITNKAVVAIAAAAISAIAMVLASGCDGRGPADDSDTKEQRREESPMADTPAATSEADDSSSRSELAPQSSTKGVAASTRASSPERDEITPLFPIYVLNGYEGGPGGVPIYKCGYIDQSGTVVVQPRYTYAGAFSDGLALVDQGKRQWAFIDRNGRVVFSVEHDFVTWFRDGLAAVLDMKTENDPTTYRTGFIDLSGQLSIPMTLRTAGAFSEGLAEAQPVATDVDKHGYGYVDKSGRFVIKARFKMASPFSEGLAAVREVLPDGTIKNGYIDVRGAYAITLQTGPHEVLMRPFSNGMAVVMDHGSARYVDRTGQPAFKRNFASGGSFSEGLAWVRLKEGDGTKCGYIDKTGELVVKAQFDDTHSFSEGFAGVKLKDAWGFIDKTGTITIAPRYSKVGQFQNGLCIVEWRSSDDTINTGYITRSGQMVWKTANGVPFGLFAGSDRLY